MVIRWATTESSDLRKVIREQISKVKTSNSSDKLWGCTRTRTMPDHPRVMVNWRKTFTHWCTLTRCFHINFTLQMGMTIRDRWIRRRNEMRLFIISREGGVRRSCFSWCSVFALRRCRNHWKKITYKRREKCGRYRQMKGIKVPGLKQVGDRLICHFFLVEKFFLRQWS